MYTPHIGEPTHITAHLHKLFTLLKIFRIIFVTCTDFQGSILNGDTVGAYIMQNNNRE